MLPKAKTSIFGIQLKRIREKRNMTQKELSKALGIKSRVSKWESGHLQFPIAKHLIRLAKIFNVSTDYLLGLTNDDTQPFTSALDTALQPEQPLTQQEITFLNTVLETLRQQDPK